MLQVHELTMRFGGLTAVSDVTFDLARGGILGLLGPNGAGKTTLLSMIAGSHRPSQGRILLDGREITTMTPHRRSTVGIARTFQITQPFLKLTVRQNVMVGAFAKSNSMKEMERIADEILPRVGLEAKADQPAAVLSTGQRKRLELARALATRPNLLLLDEITGGVDMPSIPGLIELVREIHASGVTLVVIEHNMRVMNALADRLIFLERGKVVVDGTPEAVASHPTVLQIYLGKDGGRA